MINKTVKYGLLGLMLMGTTACHKRTIIIEPQAQRTVERAVVKVPVKRPIKEEILLGNNSKNPSLGNRVDVPINNPTLGEMVSGYGEENTTEEIAIEEAGSSGIMERIPFPIDEYRRLRKRGRSTVSGDVYLENSNSSEKIVGKKLKLWLNPVTSYSRQWYEESYLGRYKLSKTDKRLYNYLKFTYSDNSGHFNFYGVPKGQYYLVGTMSCSEECGFPETTSVRLVKEVYVGSGVTSIDLMKNVP
jgi:hypothetical protein